MADHVTVPVQAELKRALIEYAKANDMSASSVARKAIADFLGVKVVEMPRRARQTTITDPVERAKMQARKQKDQRTMVKAAMLAAHAGETDTSIALLTGKMTAEEAEAYIKEKQGITDAEDEVTATATA